MQKLKHHDIWLAIDRLAQAQGLSPSALARKAGLSPTVFNPSKRMAGNRKRWPSTESIARILDVTDTKLDEFAAMTTPQPSAKRDRLPLLGCGEAGRAGYFDDAGYPAGKGWDEITFPQMADPNAFALEVRGKSMEPVYRDGDHIIISPCEKPRRGDRVALRTQKGEVMVKELGRETAQKVDLLSLNPLHPPIRLSLHEIEWMFKIAWVSQ